MFGGKRAKSSKNMRSRTRRTKKNMVSRRTTGKRPLNLFFKTMLNAKRKGLGSFNYKGNTYVGRKHPRLGMIYKKS